jgi:WD40 repeat protein
MLQLRIDTRESEVSWVNVSDMTDIHLLTGHAKTIIHISMDETGDFMISASKDGTIQVWDLIEYPPKMIKRLENAFDRK